MNKEFKNFDDCINSIKERNPDRNNYDLDYLSEKYHRLKKRYKKLKRKHNKKSKSITQYAQYEKTCSNCNHILHVTTRWCPFCGKTFM